MVYEGTTNRLLYTFCIIKYEKTENGLHKRAVGLFQPICEIMKIFPFFFFFAHNFSLYIFLLVYKKKNLLNRK